MTGTDMESLPASVERPVTGPDPAVSVVVPSLPDYDRRALVDALRTQTADQFEVLLVVDAERGVCEARNLGIEHARGEVVAFTDDDCVPPPGWVARIRAAFDAEPDLVLLEGPITDGGSYQGHRLYPTANLAVRRAAALEVGGFDPAYEYWREDTEFGWRVESLGTYRYDPENPVSHPERMRARIKPTNERRLRAAYPDRYEELIAPDGFLGRLNFWLRQVGFWRVVDRFRSP